MAHLAEAVIFLNSNQKISKIIPQKFNNKIILNNLTNFVYPFSSNYLAYPTQTKSQEFTFVQTIKDTGQKFYGFVKLRPNFQAIVIITQFYSWKDCFLKLLEALDQKCYGEGKLDEFYLLDKEYSIIDDSDGKIFRKIDITRPISIFELIPSKLPDVLKLSFYLNREISLPEILVPDEKVLARPIHNNDLRELALIIGEKCGVNIIKKLYSSIMNERTIIVTASNLTVLTSLLCSLTEILIYPLKWEHMFAPIIPPSNIDCVAAPFPAIMGLHSSLATKAEDIINYETDNGILYIDLDNISSIFSNPIKKDCFNDEKNMPGEVVTHLQSKLKDACKATNLATDSLPSLFMTIQAKLLAGIGSCFQFGIDEKISFNYKAFQELDRKWIQEKRHNYFIFMVTLQSFKQFILRLTDVMNNKKKSIISEIFEYEMKKIEGTKYAVVNTMTYWYHTATGKFNEATNTLKLPNKESATPKISNPTLIATTFNQSKDEFNQNSISKIPEANDNIDLKSSLRSRNSVIKQVKNNHLKLTNDQKEPQQEPEPTIAFDIYSTPLTESHNTPETQSKDLINFNNSDNLFQNFNKPNNNLSHNNCRTNSLISEPELFPVSKRSNSSNNLRSTNSSFTDTKSARKKCAQFSINKQNEKNKNSTKENDTDLIGDFASELTQQLSLTRRKYLDSNVSVTSSESVKNLAKEFSSGFNSGSSFQSNWEKFE